MLYLILTLSFIAVFGLILWRVVAGQAAAASAEPEVYECPVCNEVHCDCQKQERKNG